MVKTRTPLLYALVSLLDGVVFAYLGALAGELPGLFELDSPSAILKVAGSVFIDAFSSKSNFPQTYATLIAASLCGLLLIHFARRLRARPIWEFMGPTALGGIVYAFLTIWLACFLFFPVAHFHAVVIEVDPLHVMTTRDALVMGVEWLLYGIQTSLTASAGLICVVGALFGAAHGAFARRAFP